VAWAAAQDAGVDTIRGVWKGILADSSQLYITIKKQLVLQDPTTIHFAPIDWANLVGNGTTGVDLRSPRVSVEKQISVEVSQGLAQAVYGNSSPYLGVFTGKLCEHSCLNALVKAPGDLKIQVSIFDHMGVLVLSWSQLFGGKELRKLETTRDGRKLIPIAWNLRARNGAPVVSGIYLWKFLIQPKEGAQLEVIRRVGVQ
jgi:hypothetical protein